MALQVSLQNLLDFISIVTIAMCFIQKIPQILNLTRVKSAKGLSLLSLLLELTSYTVMTSYNYTNGYALLSYMEYPIILSQQYVLIFFVMKYMNMIGKKTIIISLIYFIIFVSFLKQIVPKYILTLIAPMCTPISAFSKTTQLLLILRSKNADSISITTWFISTMTNLTRVFTIWMDSADSILLGNYGISVFLSSSIMFSSMYFKSRPKVE